MKPHDEGLRLLNEFPDLTAAERQETRFKIAQMLVTGEFAPPDTFDNLPDAIRWATDLAKDPFCPPISRDLLTRWIGEANAALTGVAG